MALDTAQLVDLVKVRDLVRNGTARSIRIAAGLSLGEVARAVGVTVPAVSRWEGAERVPRGEAALRYGVLLDSLVTRGRR